MAVRLFDAFVAGLVLFPTLDAFQERCWGAALIGAFLFGGCFAFAVFGT